MRLNEMYYTIRHTLDQWIDSALIEHRPGFTSEPYFTDNYSKFMKLIEPLSILPTVKDGLDVLLDTLKRAETGGRPYIPPKDIANVEKVPIKIKADLEAMAQMCESLGVKPRESGFDVRLPDILRLTNYPNV